VSNDPAVYAKLDKISEELRYLLATMGSCQPTPQEMPGKNFPYTNGRSFHEHYYYAQVNNRKVRRLWISYSQIENKVFCSSCKLFGTLKAQKQSLATEGTSKWQRITEKIKLHECKPEHLCSEINREMYINNQRVDKGLQTHKNKFIAENREIVLAVFRAVLYIAKQNSAYRGHDEKTHLLIKEIFWNL